MNFIAPLKPRLMSDLTLIIILTSGLLIASVYIAVDGIKKKK